LPKSNSTEISFYRRFKNGLALGLITAAAFIVTVPLFLILGTVVSRGLPNINWAFLTEIPKPVTATGDIGGGVVNAIMGSLELLAVASIIGVPLGVGAGVFLAEYGRNKWGNIVRFTADVLNGVPSIVIGMTAWALVVVTQGHFSLLAGSVALGIMMIPVISRTTEEVLLLVPQPIREAAWGLGIPHWRTILSVVVPTARQGILTSIVLAFARIAGETAPLVFTALGNDYLSYKLDQPVDSLPWRIYRYATMPYEQAIQKAWGAALVLITIIMVTIILFRWIASRNAIKGAS
jgi:phosphate transport system permease protein